jgi:carbonic anhydrase/acetyltransferase-like protein (isoleucine patch superfamily)
MSRTKRTRSWLLIASAVAVAASTQVGTAGAAPTGYAASLTSGTAWCSPAGATRVVCFADGSTERASFIDPSAEITSPRRVKLGELVYVAPFAQLLATKSAPIRIGAESNVEDNAVLDASYRPSSRRRDARLARVGLSRDRGIRVAARTVFGHHTSVRGPAVLGVGGGPIPANPDGPASVILNQGAQVDGAWLEQNTAVSVFARVGPGVRLRSGMQVLPGKNVTTQAEADDPSLGKVAPLTEADIAGTELSIDANTGFAREYSAMYLERRPLVRGIGPDPGGTEYSGERSIPVTGAEGGTCEGWETLRPGFHSRIIGSVCLEDTVSELRRVVGDEVSLRADEGTDTPYLIGEIHEMHDGVVFHDVPEAGITTGDGVRYGEDSTVHSGPGRPAIVGDDVRIGRGSVVFGSDIGDRARIGAGALVGFTELPAGAVVAAKDIVFDGVVFGSVEW